MENIKEINSNMCRICLKDSLDLKFSLEDCLEMVKTVAQVEVKQFFFFKILFNPTYALLYYLLDDSN